MEIFAKFDGRNLDALMLCIEKIKHEGLPIDEHTQVVINNRSGNVWVWSDDWLGCVFKKPTSNTKALWCYSCPNCGEEYICEYYDEIGNYIKKYETKNGQRCGHCYEED